MPQSDTTKSSSNRQKSSEFFSLASSSITLTLDWNSGAGSFEHLRRSATDRRLLINLNGMTHSRVWCDISWSVALPLACPNRWSSTHSSSADVVYFGIIITAGQSADGQTVEEETEGQAHRLLHLTTEKFSLHGRSAQGMCPEYVPEWIPDATKHFAFDYGCGCIQLWISLAS